MSLKSQPLVEAYLDIETTGLSSDFCEITVVGIYLLGGSEPKFVQLVGDDATADNILQALEGVSTLYTYNGSRFDLPFINDRLHINLAQRFNHCDLMHHCWRNNLYGGFKSVEQQLGIGRVLKEINGLEAIRLWWQYVNDYDKGALSTLLAYNKEDVVNLKFLREKLGVEPEFR
ncbi:MAG: ribonuclease H-like domain-containing protein [Chloroflexota bacterium]